MGRNGIYINFLGTLDDLYNTKFYVYNATNQNFQGMVLATLLIRAVQYEAHILGYKKYLINHSIVY